MKSNIFEILLTVLLLAFTAPFGYGNESNQNSIDQLVSASEKIEFIKNSLRTTVKHTHKPVKALELSHLGLKLAMEEGDSNEISFFYHELATTYLYLGNYEKAAELNQVDLKYAEKLKDTVGIIMCLDNMGNIPLVTGDYPKALSFFLRGLELAKLIECDYVYFLHTNIGKTYLKNDNFQEAESHFLESLDLAYESDHENGIAMSYLNLSQLHQRTGRNQLAMNYAFKCISIWERIKNMHLLSKTYNHLASIYLSLDEFDSSIQYAQKAKNLSKEGGFQESYVNSLEILSKSFAKTGNYELAYQNHTLFQETKDLLLNEEKLKQLNLLETNFEINRKQQELDLLNEKNKSRKLQIQKSRYLIYLLISLIIVCVICAVFIFKHNENDMRLKNIKLERKLLRAQMNPHFIFNSLIAIQSFMFENKPEKAADFLSKYAELMRMILESSRQEYVFLDKEIRTLKRYLELQKLRFENKFEFNIQFDAAILQHYIMVPPMLIQPFIENALEHGINQSDRKGMIQISIDVNDNDIVFEIIDNGIGRERAFELKKRSQTSHISLATNITEERLEILNNRQKNKIEFQIIDLKDDQNNATGTQIIFTIPLNHGIMSKVG